MARDWKKAYCKECKDRTEHILRGFVTDSPLEGNGRWCCKKCEEVEDGK
jgi:RNase P subunit RPR2